MLLLESILIAALVVTAPAESNGYLGGVVVRASDGLPVAGAEVVLSIRQGDQFIPAAKTVADEDGKYLFEDLLVAPSIVYKPGANWGGIHYPGPAARLTPARSIVGLKLTVNEAVSEPNLLIARRHEITIRSKPGILEVTESLVIDNPTLDCYVGKPQEKGGEPETLCLNIPSDFGQVTFDEEFYGRNFSISDGRLVTGVPWTPGEQELRFTYVLPNEERQLVWTRALDLPCGDVTVRVVTAKPEDVSCSLTAQREEKSDAVTFHYSGPELEAGREIHVGLGRLPVSALAYGKWLAVAVLIALVLAAAILRRRQRGSAEVRSTEIASEPQASHSETRVRRPSRMRGKRPRSADASD